MKIKNEENLEVTDEQVKKSQEWARQEIIKDQIKEYKELKKQPIGPIRERIMGEEIVNKIVDAIIADSSLATHPDPKILQCLLDLRVRLKDSIQTILLEL